MRFLVKACARLNRGVPDVVAELGPGDSLGTGIAALLSGSNTYLALDAVSYANNARNLVIFDELVDLFKQRARIPDEKEFPLIRPLLDTYDFPHEILNSEHLNVALSRERIELLRTAVERGTSQEGCIRYVAPWMGKENLPAESVDFIFSQAVMEHIDDVPTAYACIHRWLRPTGFTAHTIDFKSHNLTREWNAHWSLGDPIWYAIRGRRPYLLNRKTFTEHLDLLAESGFNINFKEGYGSPSTLQRSNLASRFKKISNEDLQTSEGFVVASP